MKINPLWKEPVRRRRSPIILGPTNPPMLAVQLMNPTTAAGAELASALESRASARKELETGLPEMPIRR